MIESPHFKIYELVDRVTYQLYGDKAWELLHPDLIHSVNGVRDFLQVPVTVNSWYGGGPYQYRGYRNENCPVGAKNSYHKRGMAADFNAKGLTAEEVRQAIKDNQDDPRLIKIMRMEDEVSWVHIDLGVVREGKSRIYLFKA